MIALLRKLFIKGNNDKKNRTDLGMLCGGVGIFLNILLFVGKYLAGVLSASVAITADAFNNLSDAGSSTVTLIGFKLAGKKPDMKHPFGHGRVEYLSGLCVSAAIIVVAYELAKSSIEKIINPQEIDTSIISIIILVASICVKGYMFFYNRRIGKEINSTGMKATAIDCISDCITTFVVLISILIAKFTGLNVDGWCGVLVSLFIFYAGITSAKDTLTPLLGTAPDKELVDEIGRTVMSHEEICGMHDLIVHDYGPGRQLVSLHAEVNGNGDIFALHDVIDTVEKELYEKFSCETTIHMDPIETDNQSLSDTKHETARLIHEINPEMSIHDFRMVPGTTHTNLIFDVVVPFDVKISDDILKDKIQAAVSNEWPDRFVVIHIDRAYT